jgi:hypothetical protein
VWFCNRRQKEKRVTPLPGQESPTGSHGEMSGGGTPSSASSMLGIVPLTIAIPQHYTSSPYGGSHD